MADRKGWERSSMRSVAMKGGKMGGGGPGSREDWAGGRSRRRWDAVESQRSSKTGNGASDLEKNRRNFQEEGGGG